LPRRPRTRGDGAAVGLRGVVPAGGPLRRATRARSRCARRSPGGEQSMRLLAALRGEPLDRPPVWFMRQAGRYLPEYRELRERHSFLEAMRSPDIATEITLQPLRRFPLDAAIVFADIMTPLEAMGIDVDFAPGRRLAPLTVEEVCNLPRFEPTEIGRASCREKL